VEMECSNEEDRIGHANNTRHTVLARARRSFHSPCGASPAIYPSLLLDGNRREQLSGAAEMINSLWKGRLPEAVAHTPPNGPRARDFKDVAALDSFTA
jgi:hypothetical protein